MVIVQTEAGMTEDQAEEVLAIGVLTDLKCMKLFALNAAILAKCLLNQLAVNQFIAMIVLEEKGIEKTILEDQITGILTPEVLTDLKCMKLFALNAAILAKCLLNQLAINLFIEMIVLALIEAKILVVAIIIAIIKVQNLMNLNRNLMI